MRQVWAIVAAFGLGAGLAWAQNPEQAQPAAAGQPTAQGKVRGQRQDGTPKSDRQGRAEGERLMDRLTRELNLTQEQRNELRKLLGEHRDKMTQSARQADGSREQSQDLRTQSQDLRTQYQAAKAAKDKAKMKEIEAQMRQLRAASTTRSPREDLVKAIEALLTPEQAAKFQGMKGDLFGGGGEADLQKNPKLLFMAVRSLNLPPEQMQRFEPIFKDAKLRMDANQDPQARKVVANDVYVQVMAQLTPDQQTKIKEFKPTGGDEHRQVKDAEKPKAKEKSEEAKARREAKKLRKGGEGVSQQQPNQ